MPAILFTAKNIKTMPPAISKNLDGIFLKNIANQKPFKDIQKDTKPIIKADKRSGVRVKFKLTPDARASILVAIPIPTRHFKSIQQIFSSFSKKAS